MTYRGDGFVKALIGLLVALSLLAISSTAQAQSGFRVVAEVGSRVVTGYELDQQVRLLQLQNAQGDLRKRALDDLIDQRLQEEAAARAGVTVSDEELDAAIAEIGARTERSGEQFLSDLASAGIDPDAFGATTRAGLMWRNVVRQKYAAIVTVSEAEIDRELGLGGAQGGLEMQFAEIFLPTNTPNNLNLTQQLAPQIMALTGFAEFSDAARRFSVGPSAPNGGLIADWVPVNSLPANLREKLLGMKPGQVTEPIEFTGAVGLFQLRGIREMSGKSVPGQIDYMTYQIHGTKNKSAEQEAERVTGLIDGCNDLYGIARNDPADWLTRQTVPVGQIGADLRKVLDRLDPGETALLPPTESNRLVLVALCARIATTAPQAEGETGANRDAVRAELVNRKITALAQGYLQELRGETVITMK